MKQRVFITEKEFIEKTITCECGSKEFGTVGCQHKDGDYRIGCLKCGKLKVVEVVKCSHNIKDMNSYKQKKDWIEEKHEKWQEEEDCLLAERLKNGLTTSNTRESYKQKKLEEHKHKFTESHFGGVVCLECGLTKRLDGTIWKPKNNSYKQKKLEQRKNQLPMLDNLPFSFYEGGEKSGTWGDAVDYFISDLIDETEKQAQSEMRDDLIKWAEKQKKQFYFSHHITGEREHYICQEDLIDYLNKPQ